MVQVGFGLWVGIVDDCEESVRLRFRQGKLVHNTEVDTKTLVVIETKLPLISTLYIHWLRLVHTCIRIVSIKCCRRIDVLAVRRTNAKYYLLAQPHTMIAKGCGMTMRVVQQWVAF